MPASSCPAAREIGRASEEGATAGNEPMERSLTLDEHLGGIAPAPIRPWRLGRAGHHLPRRRGSRAGRTDRGRTPFGASTAARGGTNSDGDRQIDIDVEANRHDAPALRRAPVAAIVSEETELPRDPRFAAPSSVSRSIRSTARPTSPTISPSARSSRSAAVASALSTFFEPGTAQLAAGFSSMARRRACARARSQRRRLHARSRERRIRPDRAAASVPSDTPEFAINVSNRRHWNAAGARLYRRMPRRAPTARAAKISTCAGSARWSPKPTAS